MKKVGLFFGSFNPIHFGHLIIAQAVINQTECSEIWFVVSPQNPHKTSSNLLHEFDRLDLVEKAISDNFSFKSSDIEFHLPKPSYTVETLAHFSEKYPNHDFSLIIGGDNLENFKSWKNYESILKYYQLIVYPRNNQKSSDLWNHPSVKSIKAPILQISATYIRDCIKNHQSVKYLIPDEVETYIKAKKFYL